MSEKFDYIGSMIGRMMMIGSMIGMIGSLIGYSPVAKLNAVYCLPAQSAAKVYSNYLCDNLVLNMFFLCDTQKALKSCEELDDQKADKSFVENGLQTVSTTCMHLRLRPFSYVLPSWRIRRIFV